MFGFRITRILVVTVCVIFLFHISSYAQYENIITLGEMKPDKACGPRCLWALMQITEAGQPDCGIKYIYEIIDKEPFSVTSLKDLKDAAEHLGFSAKGYKLTFNKLAKIDGYAILPVGNSAGTQEDPLHFVLMKRVIDDYVIIVDTKTTLSKALPMFEFIEYWDGNALVITAGKGMEPLLKEPDDMDQLSKYIKTQKYDQIKDFGQVDNGSIVEHTFTIFTEKNEDYTAKIVQKNCACLKAKLGNDIKGRNTLTMELHVDQPAWQQAHAIILLEPGGIIKRYAVRAYGKDTFEIWPPIAHIEAPEGGLIEYPVRIDYFTGPGDVVRFDRMLSDLPNLRAGQVKSSNINENGATTFKFDITLLFDTGEQLSKIKSILGNVDFVLDTGQGQRHITMQFTARIGKEKFRMTPEKVFLMPSKSNESTIQKKIKLEFISDQVPKNITINSDASALYEVTTTREDEKSFMIIVSSDKEKLQDVSLGMHKGELIIVPEGVSELNPIKLPVSIFVRE